MATQRQLAVNELAAGVAHEFNNVLQIVSGYVTFARDSLPEGSTTREDLNFALDATERAAKLSSHLLQFARADDGELGVADASDAVEALGLLLQPVIGEDIRVEIRTESGLPKAVASGSALRQALLNLCVNARDAMPCGGELLVEARRVKLEAAEAMAVGSVAPGEFVQVSVEDTGEGICPSAMSRLFEPFYTTKAPGKGTGLGLAMVAEFVERIDGGLRVASRPGEGTRFDLYIQVAGSDTPSAMRGELPVGAGCLEGIV